MEIKNINPKKLFNGKFKITKQNLKETGKLVIFGVALGCGLGLVSCGGKNTDKNDQTSYIESTDNTNESKNENIETTESVDVETVEKTETDKEEVVTELTVEDFNKLVDEVVKANVEAGLNLRRENLELAVYINNINLATPELVQKIESSYNYNEENMINIYLQTMTSYNNDKLEYYNGEDDKCADESLMFISNIDRETIQYIDSLFEGLHVNVSKSSEIELTMPKFNMMVEDVMTKNKELGINLSREEIEISIYQRNLKYATEEVKTYIENIKLEKGKTLESVDNNTLNIIEAFNKKSKVDFNLSTLEYESYYVGLVVEELEGYMRENNTINGYTKDQLSIGGLFTAKLKTDDAFAYFATTGYANEYETNITAIAEANMEACVARTYAVLGSKAAIEECEDTKTLVHTNE